MGELRDGARLIFNGYLFWRVRVGQCRSPYPQEWGALREWKNGYVRLVHLRTIIHNFSRKLAGSQRHAALLQQEIPISLHFWVVRVLSGPPLEPPITLRRLVVREISSGPL